MINKSMQNNIKKSIVKALTDKAHGVFDLKEGYAVYNGTNLTMVMDCVFTGLNQLTWRDISPTKGKDKQMEMTEDNFYKVIAMRDELIFEQKDEISKLKMTVNKLQQKAK